MAAQHYQEALRSLLPAFREVEVANLNRPDVERFIQDRAQRYSRATLRSLRTTLSLVLGYARDNDWIDNNPVTGVKPPRTESCGGNPITRAVLTSGQVRLL